jgi:hypothetical protein
VREEVRATVRAEVRAEVRVEVRAEVRAVTRRVGGGMHFTRMLSAAIRPSQPSSAFLYDTKAIQYTPIFCIPWFYYRYHFILPMSGA